MSIFADDRLQSLCDLGEYTSANLAAALLEARADLARVTAERDAYERMMSQDAAALGVDHAGDIPEAIRALLSRCDDAEAAARAAIARAEAAEGRLRGVAEVLECGWQWRPVSEDTAFAPPFSTIRVCRGCGCLVAGGPTACARCAETGI